MPLLGGLLVNLLGGLVAFLAKWVGKKLAIATTAVAAFATVTAALLVTFRSIVSPLLADMFSTQYGQYLGLAFPPAAGNCIAAIGATWAACALYRWQASAIRLAAQAQ